MKDLDLNNKKNWKQFKKHHSHVWNDEQAYSVHIPHWQMLRSPFANCTDFSKYPVKVNDLVNIIRTLFEHYTIGTDCYKEAVKIHVNHWPKIEKARNKANKGKTTSHHTEEEAWYELLARGFKPKRFVDPEILGKMRYWVQSTTGGLTYPKSWKAQAKGWKWFEGLGVSGYTRIHQPEYK